MSSSIHYDTYLGAVSFCRWLQSYGEDRSEVVIGLCGGTSPFVVPKTQSSQVELGFLPALLLALQEVSADVRSKLRWREVDERLFVEHSSELLRREFLDPGIAKGLFAESQVELYPLELANSSDHGTAAYWQLFAQSGRFDAVILGTGYPHVRAADGSIEQYDCHVAGVFAEHESTTSEVAKKPGFISYDQSPKPPNGRVTATLELLARSEMGVLLIIGEKKHDVLREYLDPTVDPTTCPVKVVARMKNRIVVTDCPLGEQQLKFL